MEQPGTTEFLVDLTSVKYFAHFLLVNWSRNKTKFQGKHTKKGGGCFFKNENEIKKIILS